MDWAAISYIDVVIANGQTTSGEASLSEGRTLVGIITPSALTGTAITFTACDHSGGTFVPVYGIDGAAYSVTVSTSRYVVLNPADFAGIRFLKVVSGSSEGAARTIRLVVRNV